MISKHIGDAEINTVFEHHFQHTPIVIRILTYFRSGITEVISAECDEDR